MKNVAKVLALVLAVVMLAACFTGCGSKTEKASASDTFKIGGQGPLTGGAAIYGIAAMRGAQIAVDEINAAEGKTFFELKYEDDQHDETIAPNAYNALKDWGMQLYLGAVTSAPSIAVSPSADADNIFFLTPSASNDAVPAGKDNVYQMCFSDKNQGTASAQYIADKSLGSTIAVIYQSDIDYSKGIYDTFMARAKDLGLNVVSETSYVTGAVDFSVQIADAQAAGADLVFLPIYYQEASLIFAQCANAGFAPKFFGVDGMDGILSLEGFDTSLAEGVMLLTPFNADSTDSKTASFVAKYNELHKEIPNQFAADGYDCIYAMYQAIKASGVTPDMSASDICAKMVEQFNSMSFDGITGTAMTWTNGFIDKAPKGMVIENGAYVGLD